MSATQSPNHTLRQSAAISIMALNASLTGLFSFTKTVVGGTLDVVADTATSLHKTVNLFNHTVHTAADRATVTQTARDRIKRGELKLDIAEAAISYGVREEELFAKAAQLDETTRDKVVRRSQTFDDVDPDSQDAPLNQEVNQIVNGNTSGNTKSENTAS